MDRHDNDGRWLRCHTCGALQRDRRSYRDHLLRAHQEVVRRGIDTPIRLEGRELDAVWAGIRRRHESGMATASHRREQLGLPRVSDREAARRLRDNRDRTARRFRAAVRARGAATAAPGTHFVPRTARPPVQPLMRSRLGTSQARPLSTPAGAPRHGGATLPRPRCTRCLNCTCQTYRDFSRAQRLPSATPRRPISPIRPPSPPPQLEREDTQAEMSWDEAQAAFSRGGSPLPFLDASACDEILAHIRLPDGTLPNFAPVPSSPPPPLEVALVNQSTQVDPPPSRTVSTHVQCRPHQGTIGTQVLLRPPRSVSYTQTEQPAFSRTTSWSQTFRPTLLHTGTEMTPVLATSTGCQAGGDFNNDEIPPGVPRPRMPWNYTYRQFGALLDLYPGIHPEDFITFGVLNDQPRRGSLLEWRDAAGVLAHMVGGRRLLVDRLVPFLRRLQDLHTGDPDRVVEEQGLGAIIMAEWRRSRVPLGDRSHAALAAPGGPTVRVTPERDTRRPPPSSSTPPSSRPTPPPSGPSRGRARRPYRAAPGSTGTHGGPQRPPPGFVDLTRDEVDTPQAPATPPPQVSGDEGDVPMEVEDRLLHNNDSDEDGFMHV